MTLFPSEVEMEKLRRISEDYMPEHVRVYPRTAARSGSGGTVLTAATNPTATSRGRLAPMGEDAESYYAGKLGGRQGWEITLPATVLVDTTVGRTAILRIGLRSFEVLGSNVGRTVQITKRYPCKELL